MSYIYVHVTKVILACTILYIVIICYIKTYKVICCDIENRSSIRTFDHLQEIDL